MRELQRNTMLRTAEQSQIDPPPVHWYSDLDDVPRGLPSFFVAHEFFDALPVHQFRKYNGNWEEVLIGVNATEDHLCLVRSKYPTVHQTAYLPLIGDLGDRDCVEICPRALILIDNLCQRINNDKGAALIIDYGHTGEKGDTLRGFQKHKVCEPLTSPGNVDLTCDVDFSLLSRRATSSTYQVDVHGPETQAYFLINMGLLTRLRHLLTNCHNEVHREELLSGCEMLITAEQMGSRFKFLAIVPHTPDEDNQIKRKLPGFTDLPGTPYSTEPM